MNLLRKECGQTTIIMGLSLFCLCGMAGFAVDVGVLFRDKRILQTAADAGAIAGAEEYKYGDWSDAAKKAATQNGVTDGINGYTVTVTQVAAGSPHAGDIQVIASQSAPTYFMKLFHVSSMTVSARAVGGLGPASACIYALDTSGTDIGMSSSSNLSMPNCGIVVNSASNNAISLSGTATITADSVGVVGNVSTPIGAITPTAVTGVAPAFDPLSWLTPPSFNPSSCLADPHLSGSGITTIGPAVAGGTVCYNGLSVSGSHIVNLTPGLYIINGAFSDSGSGAISGTGVTFYFAPPNGSLSLSGTSTLTISAPTSGTWNGILFYEDANDTHAMTVSGSGASVIQGIFYAPSADLTLSGSSSAQFAADIVVSALSMSGPSSFSNYSSINPNEPLTAAYLME